MAAFGATYVYNNPQLQQRLGVKSFVDSLPWKDEERLSVAETHPLDFQRMTLQLSTRSGTPIGSPQRELHQYRIVQQPVPAVERLVH